MEAGRPSAPKSMWRLSCEHLLWKLVREWQFIGFGTLLHHEQPAAES
jgi:hypothetical protein